MIFIYKNIFHKKDPDRVLPKFQTRGPTVRTSTSSTTASAAGSGANESLSVIHVYDQQRRTFRVAVCEERAGAAAGAGAARQARGVLHLNRATPEKQGR